MASASSTDVPPNFRTTRSSPVSNLLRCGNSVIRSTPILKLAGTKKPTASWLLAVGSDLGYECSSLSGPVLQKTRNSCRHCGACRANSRGLLDHGIHKEAALLMAAEF